MAELKLQIFYLNGELTHAYLPEEIVKKHNLNALFGPSNLKWKKGVNFTTPMEYMSDKSRKKIIKAVDYAKDELKYQFELNESLDEKTFLEWYRLYESNITSKDTGELRVDKDWYTKKAEESKNYGSIIIKDMNNKIIGGILVSRKEDSMSCSYRAHEYIRIKDSSLAAILEYLIDEYALKFNYKLITRGTDPNLYGVRLNLGLNDFKLQYHFTPTPLDGSSNYYPRYLIFFKKYPEVFTYVYEEGNMEKIKPIKLIGEELDKYTYSIEALNFK